MTLKPVKTEHLCLNIRKFDHILNLQLIMYHLEMILINIFKFPAVTRAKYFGSFRGFKSKIGHATFKNFVVNS